jgi:biotin carboxylase
MGTSTARLFRDKLAMRVKASEAGVQVPDFVHVLNEDELHQFMQLTAPPWVLKPRMDVSAIGIQKLHEPALVWQAVQALDARPVLTERSSYFLLERFVSGDVFHVDSLVQNGHVIFAAVNRYWRPPMEVAHHGGVFVTSTVPSGSGDERDLLEMNERLLSALGFIRGATHAEFIRSVADGNLYFLEVAARVGGAYIADVVEAASGVNLWREWARIELARDQFPYALPAIRPSYGGIALALARQEVRIAPSCGGTLEIVRPSVHDGFSRGAAAVGAARVRPELTSGAMPVQPIGKKEESWPASGAYLG